MSKKDELVGDRLNEALEDAWLHIPYSSEQLYNPLETIPENFHDEPHIFILWMLTNPEYFSLFCKEILNITILPFQCVILHEMWIRKFPILIGCRGLGKCINGNTLILTNNGIKKIGDVVGWNSKEKEKIYNLPNVLNEKSEYNNVEYGWNNGYGKTIKIQTSQGFELEGTPEHPIRVVRDGAISWIELKDIKLDDYIPIDRSETWFENTEYIDKDLAYLFGLLVGDGGYTVRGRVSFTSGDKSQHDIVKELVKKFFDKDYDIQHKRPITGNFYSVDIWDDLFSKWGFNSPVCSKKAFPTTILNAPKEAVASFIRGLMDTDGFANKKLLMVEWCSKSEELAKTLQFVLTRFGIISRIKKRLNKKYQRYYYYLYIFGENVKKFSSEIGFGLKRKQDLLDGLVHKKTNTNLDIIPREMIYDYFKKHNLLAKISSAKNISYKKLSRLVVDDGLNYIFKSNYFYDKIKKIESSNCQTFDVHCKDDHSFISNGFISHNSYLLALYSILRMVFMPGRKIVITGAGFRQSKIIFEYMEKIWYNAPLLRDIVGDTNSDRNGPVHGMDMWRFVINESCAVAIPIGCLEENSLITTKSGIRTIKSMEENPSPIWGNSKYRDVGFFHDNDISPSIEVTTLKGFEYIATPNHKMKVCRNEKIIWVRTDEMVVGDRILIDRTDRWHESDSDAGIEDAYALGLMIGDGSYVNPYYMRYTTIDEELKNAIQHIGNFSDQKDGLHYQCNGKEKKKEWLDFWGLKSVYGHEKVLPQKILNSSKEKMTACLQGLFDTDGHVSKLNSKGYGSIVVGFTSTSKVLVNTIQYILLHYGIVSNVSWRDRKSPRTGNDAKRCYELHIGGHNVILFANKINFRLKRKKDLLEESIKNKKRNFSIGDSYPIFDFCQKFCKSAVKDKKSLTLSNLNKLNKITLPDDIKEICNPNIYFDEIKSINRSVDRKMYDINVPEDNEYCSNGFFSHNTGEKIRGQRAHDILVDEFAVGSAEIFEHVISGFAAVSSNPVLNVMKTAKRKRAEELNVELPEEDESLHQANQIILSGTAYYSFNHFFKYWNLWRGIINSQGDKKLLRELGIEDSLNWKDYSVIRIPYELMPEGFMEEAIVSRSRSSMHSSLFQMEFSGCFGDDSNGFFSRRLIEKCVDEHSILMEGIDGREYVIAVDPASENDNFCIVIIEVSKLTRRVVYCWTTTKRLYKDELKSGRAKEDDFYDYAARKILTLVNKFNVVGIAIDSQGGGHAIMDRLHSEKVVKKEDGEVPLWKFIDKEKPTDEDAEDGRHIIESVSFADGEYTSQANHGMRLDLEIHALLFPGFDSLTFAEVDLSIDKGVKYSDMMEEAVIEIEELKNELASIVMSQTFNGRDKWDTPDEKLAGAKKGRLRKDRYSALLMANALGKKLFNIKPGVDYNYTGGFAGSFKRDEDPKIMFTGSVLAKKLNDSYQDM